MNYQMLMKTTLFRGIQEDEIKAMLDCLQIKAKRYGKGDIVYHAGDKIESAGMILSGGAYIEHDDIWGNQNILMHIEPGELFAEAYACVEDEVLMVNVIAAEDSEILFFNMNRVLRYCQSACSYHNRLVVNYMKTLALKNIQLTYKIRHTSHKTIRDRVMEYLSYQVTKQGKYRVEIPFSRQQLADYLCVDRSALSNELSKMQKEGLLTYSKNIFKLEVNPMND